MRPHGTQVQLEGRRRRALELLDKGVNPPEIAQKVGCTPCSVYYWNRLRQKGGDEALKSKPVPGRPSKLNARQKKSLAGVLVEGAMKNGYQTDLWTTRRIAEVIDERFDVSYHPNSIWWLLKEMGWSHQKPETRARERDEKEIAHWKRHKWPHIKKVRKA
jgi:transposase